MGCQLLGPASDGGASAGAVASMLGFPFAAGDVIWAGQVPVATAANKSMSCVVSHSAALGLRIPEWSIIARVRNKIVCTH